MNIAVRDYKDRDLQDLERFVIGLQDYESQLEPDRLPGNQVFKEYTQELIELNKVFILEVDGNAVGFCAVRIDHDDELISSINEFVYLSDIYIESGFRNQNLSKHLFNKVEEYAKSINQRYVKLNVLYKNDIMRKVVENLDFEKHELTYMKQLPS